MDKAIDETLEYFMFLARHIKRDDVPSAVLLALIDMEFQAHTDGFGYLRDSISIKSHNPKMRLSAAYQEIIHNYNDQIDSAQIEQTIRSSITSAWKTRNDNKWGYYLPEFIRCAKKPSNNEFISRIACIMELWRSCKEAAYEA